MVSVTFELPDFTEVTTQSIATGLDWAKIAAHPHILAELVVFGGKTKLSNFTTGLKAATDARDKERAAAKAKGNPLPPAIDSVAWCKERIDAGRANLESGVWSGRRGALSDMDKALESLAWDAIARDMIAKNPKAKPADVDDDTKAATIAARMAAWSPEQATAAMAMAEAKVAEVKRLAEERRKAQAAIAAASGGIGL